MPEHILFDLDGTLADPFEGITGCVQYALQQLGHPVPQREELRHFIGPPLGVSFRDFCGMDEAAAAEAVRQYRVRFIEWGIHQNVPVPGVGALLKDLVAAGKTLHLATSKPIVYARQILAQLGFEQFFTSAHGSPMDAGGSPKQDVIAKALCQHNIAPQNAIMVGDTTYDVEGARACGIPCVGVTFGGNVPKAALLAAGAVSVAETADELRGILLTRGA